MNFEKDPMNFTVWGGVVVGGSAWFETVVFTLFGGHRFLGARGILLCPLILRTLGSTVRSSEIRKAIGNRLKSVPLRHFAFMRPTVHKSPSTSNYQILHIHQVYKFPSTS